MKPENKICKRCNQKFNPDQDDFSFYEKMKVPIPEICPTCRQQQRMLFRNFKTLYKRKSDKSGKLIISMYNPDVLFPVWSIEEWWADDWDPTFYGIDLDLSKPFFEQYQKLKNTVPHYSIMNTNSINCEYSNMTADSKNCYLIFGCVEDENCDYGHIVWNSKDSTDNLYLYKSELCYECIDCLGSNKLIYSQECESCVDSIGLFDCRGCTNCIGCVGLRQQSYCIFNKKVTKEEYEKFLEKFPLNDKNSIDFILMKKNELRKQIPTRHVYGARNNNVTGDHVYDAHNVHYSFDVKGGENSRYVYTSKKAVESFDVSFNPNIEYGYQTIASMNSSNIMGTHLVINSSFVYYSETCYNSKNCFGCVGLRNKQYCILNKQYAKEEYEKLVPLIIDNLKNNGNWGNFFGIEISPFGYNESIANEYMPLSKEEALKQGYKWREEIPYTIGQETIKLDNLPNDFNKYNDDLLKEVLACEKCNKNYRFINRELGFYKRMKLSLPRRCFNCRHEDRMKQRNKRILWEGKCLNCSIDIKTSYSRQDQKKYKVYCESCYNKEVY